jgi:muramoyltetrapeptide carboxypeptidase
VALSGRTSPDKISAGAAVLAPFADVSVDDRVLAPQGGHSHVNCSDLERAAAFHDACADADVVWCARGGYGLTRILSLLQPSKHRTLPTLVGFSDVTALFAWAQHQGILNACVHGPLLTTLPACSPMQAQHVWDVVVGGAWSVSSTHGGPSLDVTAPLFAGNLAVLAALVGTPWMPNLRGHIVLLEDVGERPYRVDRMLTQLIAAGAFDGAAALLFGAFTACDVAQVIAERCPGAIAGFPVGHEPPNLPMRLGDGARLVITPTGTTLSGAAR